MECSCNFVFRATEIKFWPYFHESLAAETSSYKARRVTLRLPTTQPSTSESLSTCRHLSTTALSSLAFTQKIEQDIKLIFFPTNPMSCSLSDIGSMYILPTAMPRHATPHTRPYQTSMTTIQAKNLLMPATYQPYIWPANISPDISPNK